MRRPTVKQLVTRFLAIVAVAVAAVACTPEEQAVFATLAPDAQRAVLEELARRSTEAERRAVQAHPFLVCVRRHESDTAGGYAAQNPRSTASGAYQFLDSTWRNVSPRAGFPGYSRAVDAPWWVQDAVALWTYRVEGPSHWAGSGCR